MKLKDYNFTTDALNNSSVNLTVVLCRKPVNLKRLFLLYFKGFRKTNASPQN